jgi:hypothetical protein
LVVTHTIVPAVSRRLNAKLATNRCHEAVANAQNAIAAVDSIQAR